MKTFRRSFDIQSATGESERIRIAISSEQHYLRTKINGHKVAYEELGHLPHEVDLSELQDNAPFLYEHKTDTQIGALRNVELGEDRVLRAEVDFSHVQFAQELLSDVQRGIRSKVSVGYTVHEFKDVGYAEDGLPICRAVSWTPKESSLVAIPADATVGVLKSMNPEDLTALLATLTDDDKATLLAMLAKEAPAEVEVEVEADDAEETKELPLPEATLEASADATEKSDMKDEAQKAAKIVDLAVRNGMAEKASAWISANKSVEEVQDEILNTRSNLNKVRTPAIMVDTRKKAKYSVVRGVEALLAGDSSDEIEKGREVAKRHGINVKRNSLYIPMDEPLFKRTYQLGGGNGANLASETYLPFVDALYEQSILGKIGVTRMDGANANVTVPVGDVLQGNWVNEMASIADNTGSIAEVLLTPKTYAIKLPYTRQLNIMDAQYSVEDIYRRQIQNLFVEAAETAVFSGTGTNGQPLGIFADNTVSSGSATNVSSSLASFTDMWAQQRANKGSANGTFVVDSSLYARALSTAQFSNTGPAILVDGTIIGKPVENSAVFPVNYGGAGRVGAIYGDFSSVLVTTFGVMELMVDEFTGADNGRIFLRGFHYQDNRVLQPKNLVKRSFNIS